MTLELTMNRIRLVMLIALLALLASGQTRAQQSPISSGTYDGNLPMSVVPGK
jgi:hypothetical protein